MGIIDTYGDFDLPEEKTEIEVIEDPVRTIVSCYDLFDRQFKNPINNHYHTEENYINALKALEGKENLSINSKQIEEILKEIMNKKSRYYTRTGAFLSALINQTKINTLIIDFATLEDIGYLLKKDKTLVLGKSGKADELGCKGEGNTINLGKIAWYQGNRMLGGVHINLGRCINQGSDSKNGVYINKFSTEYQGSRSESGTYINQGNIYYLARYNNISLSKTSINLGEIILSEDPECIDLSKKSLTEKFNEFFFNKKSKRQKLKLQLEQKLAELDFLNSLEELSYSSAIDVVNKFDFNKFEKEVKAISEEIYQVCKPK